MFDDLLTESPFGTPVTGKIQQPPTQKQLNYIKCICLYFSIPEFVPDTKEEAQKWLEEYAPEFEMEVTGEMTYYQILHDDAGDRLP